VARVPFSLRVEIFLVVQIQERVQEPAQNEVVLPGDSAEPKDYCSHGRLISTGDMMKRLFHRTYSIVDLLA
jgi:hypothetical protein